MPEGLEAPIAQGGTNVSGGQRQRLAIARALVRRPEIYLFDDSFSALDLATDARLRAALKPVTADATVVIVAQRVSTIADADQIVVLDDGADRRHGHARRSCSRPARPTSRSSSPSTLRGRRWHEHRDPAKRARQPTAGAAGRPARARAHGRPERRRSGGPRWPGGGHGQPRARRRWTSGRPRERLVGLLRPERFGVVAVLVLGVISVALNVIGPMILGRATDVIFAGVIGKQLPAGITAEQAAAQARAAGNATVADVIESQHVVPGVGIDFTALGMVLLAVVGIYVGASVFGYLQGYLLNGIVQRTIYGLRRDVEDKLNRLPLSYFDARQRGEVLSRVTNDIDNVSHQPAADDEPAHHVDPHGARRAR